MKLAEQQNYLLYDGDCGVCTRLTDYAKIIDKTQLFKFVAYQAVDETELARQGLTYAACGRKLQVITAAGKVYGGAFGVNYFLWQRLPWKICVLFVYLLPPLLVLEIIGYALFARYRRHISQWLGLTACALPTAKTR
jgi:predicted DCC family thiol-disulfide oxidoreductase YuxK